VRYLSHNEKIFTVTHTPDYGSTPESAGRCSDRDGRRCNNGSLQSAFIHQLAKIYKASPQAVVHNMKRYNKVKAGLDDRKKFGRKDVIEKDSAAQTVRDMLALKPGLKVEQISNNLFAEYGVRVSGCWVSRLLRKYNIQYRVPKPKKIRKVRVPKRPREPEIGTLVVLDTPEPQSRPMSIPQYQLPPPNQFPAFRQDSYQALRATSPNPPPPPATFGPVANQPDYLDVMFGILKLDNVSLLKHVGPQASASTHATLLVLIGATPPTQQREFPDPRLNPPSSASVTAARAIPCSTPYPRSLSATAAGAIACPTPFPRSVASATPVQDALTPITNPPSSASTTATQGYTWKLMNVQTIP
jgi:transposase